MGEGRAAPINTIQYVKPGRDPMGVFSSACLNQSQAAREIIEKAQLVSGRQISFFFVKRGQI